MRLHEPLVSRVTFDGKTYRIDADFRNVLRAMEITGDEGLLADLRIELALRCFVRGRLPKNRGGLLSAIFKAVLGEGKRGERVMDFSEDAERIFAAFWQAYGIDLTRDKLHWQAFRALLANLPSDTRMAEIISLRTQPLPKPTKYNAETRAALSRAKAQVALQGTGPDAAAKSVDALGAAILKLIGG